MVTGYPKTLGASETLSAAGALRC